MLSNHRVTEDTERLALQDADFEATMPQMAGDFVCAVVGVKRALTVPEFMGIRAELDFIAAVMEIRCVGRRRHTHRNSQAKDCHGREKDLLQHVAPLWGSVRLNSSARKTAVERSLALRFSSVCCVFIVLSERISHA
jgi:hypothetical protein